MYFHSIVRIQKDESLNDKIGTLFNDGKFVIFPIVLPQSEIGQYLLMEENSVFLSEYSGQSADIIYLAEKNEEAYGKFIRKVLDLIAEKSDIKLTEPAFLVFSPDKSKLIVFDSFSKKDVEDFKRLLIKMIDAIRSKRPFPNLKLLRAKASIDLKEVVSTLITFIKDAILISQG